MKLKILITIILFLTLDLNAQWLKVSEDKHHLVYENGKPFLWIGDTAWELFHRCDREEVELYFKDRAEKGFNVVQAVILAELDGIKVPNSYGELPLIDDDPLQPNEKYFEHVDWVIEKAKEYNIYLALLPTWGDKWNKKWGVGPILFDNTKVSEKYCEWLASRYKEHNNIVWILGGDRNPETQKHEEITRAMAKGLQKGDDKKHLISFHPMGDKTSSMWFHNDDWLSFNMAQTGHWRRHEKVYKIINDDYKTEPTKPCINGEPQYEDIPVRLTLDNERFTAYDIREAAYWSILSGAFGHTYGNNNIWQMWKPGREPVLGARIPWYLAIHQPGSMQMSYVRKLFESRPFLKMIPDNQILTDYFGQDYDNIKAARGKDSSFFLVYLPQGNTVKLQMKKLKADSVSGFWYNPREGVSKKINTFENPIKDMGFIPPTSGPRTDWILVLDDANKNYTDPAKFNFK